MNQEIERIQEILRNDPSNFQARRELSVMLADNGFNEEALSNLNYLLKYFPDDAELLYNIGIIYEKLKDFNNAEKAYKNAVELSPQADFYYNLGEVLVTLQKWDEAIVAFNKVLQTDADDGNCYFNLGLCYFNKDELKQSENYFQRAIELNPKDIYAHFYLGNIYQEQGLTNFAEECYRHVLEISPDYSWAYFNLASIAYQNNNIEEAKDNLLHAIDCNNQDIEAYKLLVKICIKDNDIENILTILHTRLDKETNGDLFYILAQVYKHIGKSEEYITNLELALTNALTLTYPSDKVEMELKLAKSASGIDMPDEFEEYSDSDAETEENTDNEYLEEDEEYKEDTYDEADEENIEDNEKDV